MQYYQPEKNFPQSKQLTPAEKRSLVSRENPACAFHKIVGNAAAVEQFELIAYQVVGRINHRASDLNLALTGPAGVGKTMMARALSKVTELPFIEIDPQNAKRPEDIFAQMQKVLTGTVLADRSNLAMIKQYDGSYFAPSCIVFIDEVQQLATAAQQALLRATEPSTHIMEGKDLRLNTAAVMWIFATTDRGMLFDAFDTRFMKIELLPYTRSEIASIVAVHHPEIPQQACELIAKYYYLVTREALTAATLIKFERDMRGSSWEAAVDAVRNRDGVDDYGLSRKRREVLRSLGQGKASVATLANMVGVKEEELLRYVLPPMMMYGEELVPLVTTGGGGKYITEAGLKALDRRGIQHRGRAVLTKQSQLVA